MDLKLVYILFCCVTCTFTGSPHRARMQWENEDQHNWPQSCRGQYQSPIDLPNICYPKSDITIDESMRYDPRGYNHRLPHKKMRLLNNGHTASMTVDGWDYLSDDAPSISLHANGRWSEYQFCELHFHWAVNDTEGSEHSIEGRRQAFEMHLVHFNKRYASKKEASDKLGDGLLVLGVLFTPHTQENPHLDPIVDQIQYIHKTNYAAPARKSFNLQSILPSDTSVFYMYKGSLTTPECTESVTWIIISEVQKIGYAQLHEFQLMNYEADRDRDIQKRNGRPIYANSNQHCTKDNSPTVRPHRPRPEVTRPLPDPGYRPGSGGSDNPDGGEPSGKPPGTGSMHKPHSTGQGPYGSGDGFSGDGTGGPQGSSGYGHGSGGYGSGGGSSGYRPDSGYPYGGESSGGRPAYGYGNSRPSYGHGGQDYGSRGNHNSGSGNYNRKHQKHTESSSDRTSMSSESGIVFPN